MGTNPTPSGFSPRDQGRLLREQARAARAYSRAQRHLLREQSRGLRKRSILGPLIILALGILFLLIRLGSLQAGQVVLWYGRWWPLVLVGAGVVLLAEWAWDEWSPRALAPGTPPVMRRGPGGGLVLLLIFLGLAAAATQGSGRELGRTGLRSLLNSEGWAEFLGKRHEGTGTLILPLPAGTALVIDNPRGDITLAGSSDDEKVHIEIHKRVYSDSDAETTRRMEALTPVANLSAGSLHLSVPEQAGGSADLVLSVPASTAVSLTSNLGEIRVSELSGPVHVVGGHGDVDLSSLLGSATVQLNNRGSSLSAREVQGSLEVSGTGEDLTVSEIGGGVTLDGDFYGDTHLQELRGAVHFQTSRTQFSFSRLDGSMDISPHADLTSSEIAGPLTLDTRSRDLHLEEVQGDVAITNRNGSVTLEASLPVGNLSIANRNGPITLTLPAGVSARLQAEATDGSITSDFAPQPSTSGRVTSLSGQVGGGTSQIRLQTSNAAITIRKQ